MAHVLIWYRGLTVRTTYVICPSAKCHFGAIREGEYFRTESRMDKEPPLKCPRKECPCILLERCPECDQLIYYSPDLWDPFCWGCNARLFCTVEELIRYPILRQFRRDLRGGKIRCPRFSRRSGTIETEATSAAFSAAGSK